MSLRKLLTPLAIIVGLGACTESTSPPAPASGPTPNFLHWAPGSASQFSALGGTSQITPTASLLLGPVNPPVVTSTSSQVASGENTISWQHTVGSQANRLMIVSVSIRNAKDTVSDVSFGGRALTNLGAQNNHDNTVRVELWSLVAPASGSATVQVTLSGKVKAVATAITLAGVDQVAPMRGFLSNRSTDTGTLDPTLAYSSVATEYMVQALAAEGSASPVTPFAGQTQILGATGTSGGEALGAMSSGAGATNYVAGWSKSGKAKWAVGGVAVKPFVVNTIGLTTYQASFWAKRGASRTLQINYAGNGGTSPFMKLTVSDPTFVPGRGNLAVGDSVLITAIVDPNVLSVDFAPNGTQFGTASQLTMWYTGAGGDLNNDGRVDSYDTTIENQLLGMWWSPDASTPWAPIASTKNTTTKSFLTALRHFSRYAISW